MSRCYQAGISGRSASRIHLRTSIVIVCTAVEYDHGDTSQWDAIRHPGLAWLIFAFSARHLASPDRWRVVAVRSDRRRQAHPEKRN